jgi:hypothetical protein
MIFLIEYDRSAGNLVTITAYDDGERESAENAQLERELTLNRDAIHHELVLLQADDLVALLRTHRRYFQDKQGIVNSAAQVPG